MSLAQKIMKKKKKSLTQRISDLELVTGRLLSKLDHIKLEKTVGETELFCNPERAGLVWSANEKLSFVKMFLTFIETRATYHRRSVDAMLAYLEHNGLLREDELRRKHDKLSQIPSNR